MEHDDSPDPSRPLDNPKLPAAQRWRAILAEQGRSGLGVAAFCRQRSIPASSFFGWRRKLGRAGADAAPEFARVKVVPEPVGCAGSIDVCLRGGRRLRVRRGFDAALLAEVIGVLEGLA